MIKLPRSLGRTQVHFRSENFYWNKHDEYFKVVFEVGNKKGDCSYALREM